MKTIRIALSVAACFLLIVSTSTQAGIGDKLKKKAEKKIEKKAEEKADEALSNTSGDGGGASSAGSSGSADASGGDSENAKPGNGVWANYDFVPGDRIVYFEDFSTTGVGDFPQRLEFREGNLEVVEWKGERWLRANNASRIEIPLPEVLPQRFTLEFDYYGPATTNTLALFDGTDNQEKNHGLTFFWYLSCGVGRRGDFVASTEVSRRAKEKVAHCRAMSDGKYLKVYVNDTRVANVPNTTFGRSNSLPIQIWANAENPLMIGNIRIAEGGKTIMYDQLMAEGKFSTQGILFASGSDVIRPESTPTLKEMGTMLKNHPELKLAIHGHTDNVGEDAYNLDLSKRRAAAVKSFLQENYAIEEGRLSTDGFGEGKPVADNGTPEGRQTNRRVELVKL